MATAQITSSMAAHAQVLLERAATWARGYDTRDGRQFVLFTSSRTRGDQPIYYYTGAAGDACTCPSYLYRGACSHAEACRLEAERARAAVGPKRASYEELFPADDYGTVSAF